MSEKGIGDSTGKPLHYKGIIFHRIIKGFMAHCEIVKKPKSELTEFGKLPSSEFTSSEKYPKLKGQVKCLGGMKIKM
ncbi:hypothetical protein OROMI_018213 [Orobanche minor]